MGEPIRLKDPSDSTFNQRPRIYRDGIELEKGVLINEDWLVKNEDLMTYYWNLFSAYPDLLLELYKPVDSNFHLYPYQILFLRCCFRYRTIFITAARATSKTFLSILAKFLQCIMVPNHVGSIIAPNKAQAAKVAKQKIDEILRIWPLLAREVEEYAGEPHITSGKDYLTVYFKNGSTLSIGAALNSDRGRRVHAVFLDEARDLDGEMVQEVVLPQLNVSRRTLTGEVNPHEMFNTQVIYATSAGAQSSYAYDALIDTFEQAIIDPKRACSIGLDYRIPMMHGLIDPNFVKNLKLSPSYNELTFASEYVGLWQGSSDESWFRFDRLVKHRKLKNPEWKQKFEGAPNIFYLMSVDIARIVNGDQSIICVFRVNIKDGRYFATLVNMRVLGTTDETKTFQAQTIEIKKTIQLYNVRECVVDINGLGRGVADLLIEEQTDAFGNVYPAYGIFNDDTYKKIQPKDAPQIIYGMIGSGPLNSKIHTNAYSRISNGMVRFLISEQDARAALLSTRVGQKMSLEERVKRLMPHELTTKLFQEMGNLRLKKSGLDVALEQINSRFPKDKYFAFAYGLWRIKELEEASAQKRARRSKTQNRNLIFFTGGAQ